MVSMSYVLRVVSACLWGMEAGQLLGREGWVLCEAAAFALKRACGKDKLAASTSTQLLLLQLPSLKCEI